MMIPNDILRRLRYIVDFGDAKMMETFALGGEEVSREDLSNWLKKDDDPQYKECSHKELATFLNGLINEKRGKKEGEQPKPESSLTNNIVFRKLMIAFNLRTEDVISILELADLRVSKHELSSFFRKSDHRNYRECKDQILRNFLSGLQKKLRAA